MKIALLITLLSACFSNPHDYTLPPEPEKWAEDEGLRDAIAELSDEEKQALTAYTMRKMLSQAFGGDGMSPLGVTIGEAIQEQAEWKAGQDRQAKEAADLAERIKAEREVKQSTMYDAMTVAVTSLTLRPGRYSASLATPIAFENHTETSVSGVKGAIRFSDMFGDPIKTVNVSYDGGVPAGGTAVWAAEIEYNKFMSEDVKLGNATLDNLKVTWEPEAILFTDGTSLTLD